MSVRSFIQRLDFFATILLVALLLTGCALGGTEAGNPSLIPRPNKAAVYFTEDILHIACNKLNACYPTLSIANCETGVKAQANFAPALGLGAAYATFQDAINAERSGTVMADLTRGLACENDIAILPCGSAPALNAYSLAAPADFSNVVSLIPTSSTSCAGVF